MGRWVLDAGFLCQVPITFPLMSSQRPTASCGRDGKGVIPAPILSKEKQRGQDVCPRTHSRRATIVKSSNGGVQQPP